MDSRWLGVIVLIIVVALGGWYVFSHPATSSAPAVEQATSTSETASTTAMVPAPVMVSYTDTGFSPKSVTVVEGQTVTWTNDASDKMWVASGVHPTHAVYDGTDKTTHCAAGYTGPAPFDECMAVEKGGSYSFIFTKAGTWSYHNHVDAKDTGSVIVTAANSGDMSASTTMNVQTH